MRTSKGKAVDMKRQTFSSTGTGCEIQRDEEHCENYLKYAPERCLTQAHTASLWHLLGSAVVGSMQVDHRSLRHFRYSPS